MQVSGRTFVKDLQDKDEYLTSQFPFRSDIKTACSMLIIYHTLILNDIKIGQPFNT